MQQPKEVEILSSAVVESMPSDEFEVAVDIFADDSTSESADRGSLSVNTQLDFSLVYLNKTCQFINNLMKRTNRLVLMLMLLEHL
jgi:hypothetical protein